MGDMNIGIAISQVTMLLSVAIPIIVFTVILRKLGLGGKRRNGLLGALGIHISTKWRVLWLALSSAFIGLMIATAGGAIYPPLIQPAAQLLCDGSASIRSQGYSYKPGQTGTSHTIICTTPDGASNEITFRSVFAAAALYSVAIFLLRLLWWLIRRRDDVASPDAATGLPPESSPGSDGVVDLTRRLRNSSAATNARTSASAEINAALRGLSGVLGERVARSIQQALESIPEDNISVTVSGREVCNDADIQRKIREFSGATSGTIVDPQTPQDAASRLRQLQTLRDQGLISTTEYDTKRAAILQEL